MPTEPRQVEVVCDPCGGTGMNWAREDCVECGGYATQHCIVAPSSLTARLLDLAEVVDRWHALPGDEAMAELLDGESTIVAALAAVRSHPDYRRPE